MNALEFLVVCSAAGRVDESTGNAGDEKLIVNLELDDGIELLFALFQHLVEFLSLDNSTRETVENETNLI